MELVGVLIGVVVLFFLYMLPTFIATARGHKNVLAIGVLNLFLGWSLLGWLAALIWSFTYQERK
jgi:hypothetical protein